MYEGYGKMSTLHGRVLLDDDILKEIRVLVKAMEAAEGEEFKVSTGSCT